ncbi:MAG: hypothetical protein QG653_605, partial [Patescibacteria group bacterium]|nr:hypothetical protein [Patescibacteria group bacterium]
MLEPGFVQGVTGNSASSLATDPSAVFSFLWVFGIILCVIAAGFIISIGGVKLTAATSSDKALDAKKDIQRAVYGLLGVLGLWLVLNQVNPDLLRGDIRFQPVTSRGGGGAVTPTNPTTTPPISTNRTITGARSHENIKTTLVNYNIQTNRGYAPCTEAQRAQTSIPACTDIQGLPDEILNVLKGIRQDCPSCSITITGGTEPGHKTHGKCNYSTGVCLPAVDLRLEQGDALWNLITNPANQKLNPPA